MRSELVFQGTESASSRCDIPQRDRGWKTLMSMKGKLQRRSTKWPFKRDIYRIPNPALHCYHLICPFHSACHSSAPYAGYAVRSALAPCGKDGEKWFLKNDSARCVSGKHIYPSTCSSPFTMQVLYITCCLICSDDNQTCLGGASNSITVLYKGILCRSF